MCLSWALLGRSWAVLGRSWGVIGGSWGDLGRPRGVEQFWGSAVLARSVAPPIGDFLRKYLPSRDLEITTYVRDVQRGATTRRAALGAADLHGLRPHAAGPQFD